MNHQARNVGCMAQRGIAHDVKVRKSRESKCFANPMTTRFLNVTKQFCCRAKAQPSEKCEHMRGGILGLGTQTVGTLIRRSERRVPLRNNIRLP